MRLANHPYADAHMTRTSDGNVPACCDLAPSEHPEFVNGTKTTVRMLRDVRGLRGGVLRKGTIVSATRSNHADTLKQIVPTRWFTNERGNMEEQRGTFEMVASPGWTVVIDDVPTGIPWKWAREA